MQSFSSNKSNGKWVLTLAWISFIISIPLPPGLDSYFDLTDPTLTDDLSDLPIMTVILGLVSAISRISFLIFKLIWVNRAEKNLNKIVKESFNTCCDMFLCTLPSSICNFIVFYRVSSALEVHQMTFDRSNDSKVKKVPIGLLVFYLATSLLYFLVLFKTGGDPTFFTQLVASSSELFFILAFMFILKQEEAVEELWKTPEQMDIPCQVVMDQSESESLYHRPSSLAEASKEG